MPEIVNPERPTVVDLPGSEHRPVRGSTKVGHWSDGSSLEVSVLLRRRSVPDGFPPTVEIGAQPVARRRYLSRDEFALQHGALLADVEKIRDFARGFDLTVGETSVVRRTVKLRGAPAAFERAFEVELLEFTLGARRYRTHYTPIRIPAYLAHVVEGVFGLDSRPLLRPHVRRNADPAAVGLSIPAVGQAYAFPPSLTGAGVTVGILEFGGGYSLTDIEQFFTGLKLPTPVVVPVGVNGASNAPTGSIDGPDAEVELDIEMFGALAPKSKIVVYFAPNTEQGFVDAITTAVHDTTNQPTIISISWGGPEESWSAQGRAALEEAARDGAVQGVSILAASGDQGASDGEPAGTLAVDFPASSPYVLGCGGTRLELSGTTIVSETVWNDLREGEGATGGGVSQDFSLPSYQADANVPVAPDGFQGRGVPDVAANADPDTGYAVFVDGRPAVLGGTSAVAPMWAALLALFGQALAKPLGYANPLLYAKGAEAGFRPVPSGNNDGYSAGPGWNPCTGLGSPKGQALLGVLLRP